MSEKLRKNRNGIVDLYKFIASLGIMSYHLFLLGGSFENPARFPGGWLYVELFLFLTGYYTAKHFGEDKPESFESASRISLHYTAHKFRPFFPYIILNVLLSYFLSGLELLLSGNGKEFLQRLAKAPFEILLLSSATYDRAGDFPSLTPIWFLSSMFLVFPLFCLFLQYVRGFFRTLLCLSVCIPGYGFFIAAGLNCNASPFSLIRVFLGLMTGALIYDVASPGSIPHVKAFPFWPVHTILVILPILLMFSGEPLVEPYVLCFFALDLWMIFTREAVMALHETGHEESGILRFLGKISLVVYLSQKPAALLIQVTRMRNFSDFWKATLWVIGTFAFSCIQYMIFGKDRTTGIKRFRS